MGVESTQLWRGKPLEEGSMPPSVVMSLDRGQMSGLLLVSANRQTGGTIVTRGHTYLRGCLMGKTGLRKAWPRHAGLPLSVFVSLVGCCRLEKQRETNVGENHRLNTIIQMCSW